MILHLVTKHFVTNSCLSVFDKKVPGQNIVLILSSMPGSVSVVNNGVEVTTENESLIVDSLDFSIITHVVIHYLTPKTVLFVQKYVPDSIPLYWWTYGGDLYMPFLERRGYNVYYNDLTPFRSGWTYMVYRSMQTLKSRLFFRLGILLEERYMQTGFIDRIEGIIPCIPPDYELACKFIKKDFKILRIHPTGIPSFCEDFQEGKVIAVGHSASSSDNHLYALKYLANISINDAVVSITLSYNVNSNRYLNAVKARYKKRFKEKVHFVEDYLTKDEYYKSQNDIKIMILPTWRQEALSNITSCMIRGIKLYLSKKGPLYNYYLSYGFKVFALEDINQNEFDTPLTIEEKQYNRELYFRFVEEKKRYIDEDFKKVF